MGECGIIIPQNGHRAINCLLSSYYNVLHYIILVHLSALKIKASFRSEWQLVHRLTNAAKNEIFWSAQL